MSDRSRQSIVAALSAFDSLLEVGIGRRTDVAHALAARGRTVIAIDVDGEAIEGSSDAIGDRSESRSRGSLHLYTADVQSLVHVDDPLSQLCHCSRHDPDDSADQGDHHRTVSMEPAAPHAHEIDAVYACNLPAELQGPTAALARHLDAACLFTTLGFEEPVIPVTRNSLRNETLFRATDDLPPGRR